MGSEWSEWGGGEGNRDVDGERAMMDRSRNEGGEMLCIYSDGSWKDVKKFDVRRT
jgi:hypothetical protein